MKVDTGAYNSSLHCHSIQEVIVESEKILSFIPLDPSFEQFKPEAQISKNYKVKNIRSSNGQVERRFLIQTRIKLFGEELVGYFSLTDRSAMRYPVLLGRKLLHKNFVVDVSKSYLSYKSKRKQ